jgi:uncharacterized protein DUF4333
VTSPRRPLAFAAAVVLGATTFAACGEVSVSTSQTLSVEDLETALEEDLANTTGEQIESVDCPGEEVESTEGEQIECTLTLPDGQSGAVNVTFTDDEGNFDYEVPAGEFK